SGAAIPADGLIEIITLDENGKATVKTDLPMGSYYVKELATDEHYILNDEKYPVVFEYAGQDTALVKINVNDGEAIENELLYGSVSGKKVDENGEALAGAVIGLFKTADKEFTKETHL
ncbi:Collagen adhesion protein, partial [human gut metagenome]